MSNLDQHPAEAVCGGRAAVAAEHAALALTVGAERPSRVLILGGEPFEERIVLWWNLVGPDHDEIVRARADWMAGRRFGAVDGYDGEPLPAPAMPATRLKPRGRGR